MNESKARIDSPQWAKWRASGAVGGIAPQPKGFELQGQEMRVAFIANREVRRVPLNWQHPVDERGFEVPLYDFSHFSEDSVAEYNEGLPEGQTHTREEVLSWHMPDFSNIPTDELGISAYETTTEGTPISPVFPNTPEGRVQLAEHCAKTATTFGNFTADAERWTEMLFGEKMAIVEPGTQTPLNELPGQNDATAAKAVQMPSQDQVLLKLSEAGLYGTTTQLDRFYDSFATYASGHEIVGQGLVMAWELAGYDTLAQYPPQIKAIVDMYFDRVIDAITPDAEVAQVAKDFRKRVREEAQAEAIAAEPKAEDLGPADSLNDLERFSQAREIANIVFEYASGNVKRAFDQIWMEDRRNEDANPFYDQTHRGFFLEGYYGQISKLHTPWGSYGFGGSGSGGWDEVTPKILERLGATEVTPEHNTQMGTIGPVWAVHSIDGVALPDPVEKPRSQFTPYEEVKAAWGKLKREYATAAKASK